MHQRTRNLSSTKQPRFDETGQANGYVSPYRGRMRHDVTLSRGDITLRPLTIDDAPKLLAMVDVQSWSGMGRPLPENDAAMAAHLQCQVDDPNMVPFAVELAGRMVGRTNFYDLVPNVRVDIGHTIYDRHVWGSHVNPTAKLLLLRYAFDELAVARVGMRCDHRNSRSHRAIAYLGATFEGTLRRFRPTADGTIADVDYFSITQDDWPAVRAWLESRLSRTATTAP